MSHSRYWAATLAAAVAGGFLALDKFAFSPVNAVWVGFGVAIAAGVFSMAATAVALVRQNQAFSGLSAISTLLAAFAILATRAFAAPTALWLVFATGIAVLLVSLRALALHESTVERVVHSLERGGAGAAIAVRHEQTASPRVRLRDELEITDQMRSWMHWLTHTALGLGGAFVVLTTFAWSTPPASVEPRWVWLGIGVAGASMALLALAEHGLAARGARLTASRGAAIAITVAALGVSAALVLLMALHGAIDYRWVAFGLGSAMVGVSLVASIIHELSSERVRHELEIAHAAPAPMEAVPAQ